MTAMSFCANPLVPNLLWHQWSTQRSSGLAIVIGHALSHSVWIGYASILANEVGLTDTFTMMEKDEGNFSSNHCYLHI